MPDLIVIFRTPSQIEADVVRGLLETHGIATMIASDMSRTPFPLTVNELRIAVHAEDAAHAKRIIDSHRDENGPGRLVPFGSELEPLERRIGYRFKDRGLLEHALTHRSRVHEDASGGVFDNESMEFLGDSVLGFVIADHAVPPVPAAQRGAEVEAEGVDRLGDLAGAARRADRSRRVPDSRTRRGEDRRTPEARAHRRLLRGADRGDLSRRRASSRCGSSSSGSSRL